MFELKGFTARNNFPIIIETSRHIIVNGNFYRKEDFSRDYSLFFDKNSFIDESFLAISLNQTINIPRPVTSGDGADRISNHGNIHSYVSSIDSEIEYLFLDSIATGYSYFITINYRLKTVVSLRVVNSSMPKSIYKVLDETDTTLIVECYRTPFSYATPTSATLGAVLNYGEINKLNGAYKQLVYKEDANGTALMHAKFKKTHEDLNKKYYTSIQSVGLNLYSNIRFELDKVTRNLNYIKNASDVTINQSAVYCLLADSYDTDENTVISKTFFNPTTNGLVPTKLSFNKNLFNDSTNLPTVIQKNAIGTPYIPVGTAITTGASFNHIQNLNNIYEDEDKIIFSLTLNSVVDRAYFLNSANTANLASLRKNIGFSIIEYNKNSDSFVLLQEERMQMISFGTIFTADLSKMIFLTENGIRIYQKEENNTYSLILEKNGFYVMAGFDQFERLWLLNDNNSVEFLSSSKIDRIKIEIQNEDSLVYKGTNLDTNLVVNVLNAYNEKIAGSFKVILKGNCQFLDGSTEKVIQSVNGSPLSIPIVITGSGIIGSVVEIEGDLGAN